MAVPLVQVKDNGVWTGVVAGEMERRNRFRTCFGGRDDRISSVVDVNDEEKRFR